MSNSCKKVLKKCHFQQISVENSKSVTDKPMKTKYLNKSTLLTVFKTIAYKKRVFSTLSILFIYIFVETVENNII